MDVLADGKVGQEGQDQAQRNPIRDVPHHDQGSQRGAPPEQADLACEGLPWVGASHSEGEALTEKPPADVQEDEAGDQNRIPENAWPCPGVQFCAVEEGKDPPAKGKPPHKERKHAYQDSHAEQVAAQTINVTDPPLAKEDPSAKEPLQDVSEVDQNVIAEPPDDEDVSQSWPPSGLKGGPLGQGQKNCLEEAPWDLAEPELSRTPANRSADTIDGSQGESRGRAGGNYKQHLLCQSRASVPRGDPAERISQPEKQSPRSAQPALIRGRRVCQSDTAAKAVQRAGPSLPKAVSCLSWARIPQAPTSCHRIAESLCKTRARSFAMRRPPNGERAPAPG